MPHPLITQLRFARSEFLRGIAGLDETDARCRVEPMNCISWNIGHLAALEQRVWLTRMQDRTPMPELQEAFGYGSPASTPALDEMLAAWHAIVAECEPYLSSATGDTLAGPFLKNGQPTQYSLGTILLTIIYHYWYHIGEIMAVRQVLGHKDLAEYVGDIHTQAPYEAW